MSILIKGMEMPQNCAYCPLSKYRNTSLGQILDCKRIGTVWSAVRGTHDVLNHRHPNCPLVDSPEPHWIPVTERLPEEETDVLVTVHFLGLKRTHRNGWNEHIKESYYVEVASHINGEWSSASDEYKIAKDRHKVVAWMPLPEAWRGEVTE